MSMTRSELKDLVKECIEEINLEESNLAAMEESGEYDALIKEAYMDVYLDEQTDAEPESLEEGANLDMRKAFKAGKQEFKAAIKAGKKELKAGNKDAAKAEFKKAEDAVDKMIAEIKKCDSTAGSVILGYFAGGLLVCLEFLPLNLASIGAANATAATGSAIAGGAAAGIGIYGVVKGVTIFIKQLKQFISSLADEDASTADAFNKYRNQLLRYCNDLKKICKKLQTKC